MFDWLISVGDWVLDWPERRRLRRYPDLEAQMSNAEFGTFSDWASGPWTEEFARRLPRHKLREGPPLNTNDAESRRVIRAELDRRFQSSAPVFSNYIAGLALLVSAVALFRSS